jgi:hypothetical protein
VPKGLAPHVADVGSALHHARLREVETGVVLDEKIPCLFAVVAEGLQAINVRGFDLLADDRAKSERRPGFFRL